ncbi:MAG: hypothetical protein HIU82_18895, partial [Proteobacteria bacterium]|nr:hypothetical protein [Pseudomonadota bacterium]
MKPAADDGGRARRRHHFGRRSRAAREGHHLPTLEELLLDMPFFRNDLAADAQAWAEILLPRLIGTDSDGNPRATGSEVSRGWPAKSQRRRMRADQALSGAQKLVLSTALRALTVAPGEQEASAAAAAFRQVPGTARIGSLMVDEAAARCDFYAAVCGDSAAMQRLATTAAQAALVAWAPEVRAGLAQAALGWAAFAGGATSFGTSLTLVAG